jgi:hypothetical protein
MKIICLEEHTVDADIARASQPGQTSEAGYIADWASRVEDKPAAFTDNRPHLVSPKEAVAAAREVGASLIAAMGSVFSLATGPAPVAAPVVPASGLIPLANGTSFTTRPFKIQLPKVDQWNLAVQQSFQNTTVEIAYVGNYAERAYPGTNFGYNINIPHLPSTPADLANQAARRPLFNKFNNNGVVCCNTTVSSTAPAATAILAFKLKVGLYLNFTR